MSRHARRSRSGFALVAVGVALLAIGLFGVLSGRSDSGSIATDDPPATSATFTPSPDSVAAPEPTATVTETAATTIAITATAVATTEPAVTSDPAPTAPPPEPTASEVPALHETLDGFVAQFNAANGSGDTSFPFERLHPVVLDIYSPEQCSQWLADRFAFTTVAITGEPTAPSTADIAIPGGGSAEVSDYFTVAVELTFQGAISEQRASYAYIDGALYWFTNCEA